MRELTCGGLKYDVAQVIASMRFCRASDLGFASGNWDPAETHADMSKLFCSNSYSG